MKPLDPAFHEQLGLLLADIGRKGVPYDGAKNVQIAELLKTASEDNCFTRGNSCDDLVHRNCHRLFIADTFSKQMSAPPLISEKCTIDACRERGLGC